MKLLAAAAAAVEDSLTRLTCTCTSQNISGFSARMRVSPVDKDDHASFMVKQRYGHVPCSPIFLLEFETFQHFLAAQHLDG